MKLEKYALIAEIVSNICIPRMSPIGRGCVKTP